MYIRKIDPREKIPEIVSEIHCKLRESRFVADITHSNHWVKINTVRLRHKKAYCGNHGGPCVRPHVKEHSRLPYLEGADWVEFNDMLNDICDNLSISATIASVVCVIRRGECRRVEYDTVGGAGTEWAKEGELQNCVGKAAPPSSFPEGTPGVYGTNYFCVG